MENKPRSIINIRNFYPNLNFIESFNEISMEIGEVLNVSVKDSQEMRDLAANFHNLAVIIINQFKSVEDTEDDEFLDSFKSLNFLTQSMKNNPLGPPLTENVLTEISIYLKNAELIAKISKFPDILAKVYISMGDLAVLKEDYWVALNNYNDAKTIAENYNLEELYDESQILLGIFDYFLLWRAEFISSFQKEPIRDEGLNILKTTEENLRNSKYLELKSIYYGELANIFYQQGNYSDSEQYYLNAIELSNQANLDKIKQKYCFKISKLYESIENFDKAIDLMEQAKEIASKLENYEEKAHCLINLAILYEEIGDIPESDKCMAEAEELIQRIKP